MKKGGYTDFDEFVKDVAQIFYNAKFYNSKSSEVFKDAATLEVPLPSSSTNIDVQKLLADELQQLQSRGYIETAEIPNLGPLPPSSPVSPHSDSPAASDDEDSRSSSSSSANSDSEPSDDDDDDAGAADDDEDEYNEKGVKIPSSTTAAARSTRTRTRRTASLGKLDSADGDDKKEESTRPKDDTPKLGENEVPRKRKRGRPPKIDTPEEARIRSILRTVRKVKDADGRQLFLEFEKLPDQELYPDYYNEIKKPIALDFITVLSVWVEVTDGCRKRSRDGITRRWKLLWRI